jgi:membrane-associated phospholipid phosphatase
MLKNSVLKLKKLMRTALAFFIPLTPLDALFVFYLLLLTLFVFAGASSLPGWLFLAACDIFIALCIVCVSRAARLLPGTGGLGRLVRLLHLWYAVPVIFVVYKQMYLLVPALRPGLHDPTLIALDRLLFHIDITVALQRIASPPLTEVLQIAYGSFYFLPFALAVEILRKKMFRAFRFCAFCLILGFFLAYLGYFIFPAVGPRFTLHDFYTINTDLPGLFFTNSIRDIVNAGASASSTHPHAADLIQRDVFPSAHTQLTLVLMYLSVRLKTAARFFLIPTGLLLILSTVYLRYHYLVDLAGGALFCGITLLVARPLYNAWQSLRGEEPFSYGNP